MRFYYYTGNDKIGHTFFAIVDAASLDLADEIMIGDYGMDSKTPGIVVSLKPK